MSRRLMWTLAFALAVVSCTDGAGEEPNSSSAPSLAATSSTATTTPPTPPGRLAIVDSAGDVAVIDPDGSNRLPVTERGGSPSIYLQPIWSPDGSTLAWGQATGTGFGVGISEPGSGEIRALTTPNLPFYNYWSPDSRHLGILHNGTSGVQFQIADVDEETTSVLDEDAPFYFSWSPDGDRVVTHAGATRAETIRPDGEREKLDATAAGYLAPQWTAAGVFHVVDDRLIVEDDQGERQPVAVVSGVTMFVANRQGILVALQSTPDGTGPITASTEDLPAVGANEVAVIDVSTGETETVSDTLAAGFFWSADGERLLILSTSAGEIVPLVWSRDGQSEYPSYAPSPSMIRDTFPFFPQYAQSVSFWAPDSSAFTYAGEVDGRAGIWVQPLDAPAPRHVADGTWAAWSSAAP